MKHWRIYTALVWLVLACAETRADTDTFAINGFTEAVEIVPDLNKAVAFYLQVSGWEVVDRSPVDANLKTLWNLPKAATFKQVVLANPGEDRGYLRLIEISNVEQRRIRSNTQAWDTGGIFDLNVRVRDMAQKSVQLQALGWQSDTAPLSFEFGPFEVTEWIVKSADGVGFALIERIKPTLEGWPHLKEFSRIFNSTQVVKDINVSLAFYREVLGFKSYLEHRGASKSAAPNVLGLPHNIATEIERSVYILHPEGLNEGSVELLQFHGATGKDVSALARPPNIGIVTLRFPVSNLPALIDKLKAHHVDLQARTTMTLAPYGKVDVIAIKSPDNTWLEFYQPRTEYLNGTETK